MREILIRLVKGSYIETDGMQQWVVDGDNKYELINSRLFKRMMSIRGLLVSRKIDDETSIYVLTDQAKEYLNDKFRIK